MNIILLQAKVTDDEINQLLHEFPNYLFLSFSEATYKNMGVEEWKRVEVLFGNRLTDEELQLAPQLRWVHSPSTYLPTICMDTINEQGNILVTTTVETNALQVGEFVTATILAFAKNLLHWKDAIAQPEIIWDSKWRDTMWCLESKILLVVGLDEKGTEVARKAKEFGMRVWGVKSHKSFHPYFDKVFTYSELKTLLPACDAVCLNLTDSKEFTGFFGKQELDFMKQDSILISLGSNNIINAEALVQEAEKGKFRGIYIDASFQLPIPLSSPLWQIPGIIISPGVAQRPKTKERLAYKFFRYNLRQYVHGNFRDMRNIAPSTSGAISTNT